MAAMFGSENEWVLRRYGKFIVDIEIILDGEEFILGRGKNRGIPYSVGVSRRHALLKRAANGEWKIKDLGSMNGLYINSIKIANDCFQHLKEFDIIGLGVACSICEDHYSFMLCRKPVHRSNKSEHILEVVQNNTREVKIGKNCDLENSLQQTDFNSPERRQDNNATTEKCKKEVPDNLNKIPATAEKVEDEEVCIISHTINYKTKRKDIIIISDDSASSDVEVIHMPQKRRKVRKRKHIGLSAGEDEQIYNEVKCENARYLSERQEYSKIKEDRDGPNKAETKYNQNLHYSHICKPEQQDKCESQHDIPQSPNAISKQGGLVKVEAAQCSPQNDDPVMMRNEENFNIMRDKQMKLAKIKECALPHFEILSSNSYQGDKCKTGKYITEDNGLNGNPQPSHCEMPIDDTVDDFFSYDDIDSGIDEDELRSRIVWPSNSEDSSKENISSQLTETFVNAGDRNNNKLKVKESSGISYGMENENLCEEGRCNDLNDKLQPNDRTNKFCSNVDSSDSGIDEEQSCNNIFLPKVDDKTNPLCLQHYYASVGSDERNIECRERSENLTGEEVPEKCHTNSFKLIETLSITITEPKTEVLQGKHGSKNLKRTSPASYSKYKSEILWSKRISDIVNKLPEPDIYTTDKSKNAPKIQTIQRFASRTNLLLQSMLGNDSSFPVNKRRLKK